MGYQVKCDWCDAPVDPDDDHAVLEVAVNRHKEVRSILDRKWTQETRPTLHFCVEPRESTDRMGLVETEGEPDDCYQRAMAAIHLRSTERPDMGMEWRLLPVGAVLADPVTADEARGNRTPPPIPVPPDADLETFLATLAPSPRSALGRALRRQGISTLEQLDAMSDDELMALAGVGWKTRCDVRSFLAARAAAREETPGPETSEADRPLWEEGYPGLLARELCDAGLDLPHPKRLHEVGIDTLGDLRRAVEAESLLTIKGIGPATLKSIRERLDTILAGERVPA